MFAADTYHPNKTLQAKLDHIFTLKRAGRIDLTIRPEYFTLLERLGNPHHHLPPVIHVAGTNGKGSTIAFMRAILEAAGYKVHVYTSPHLIQFNERIVLAGQQIDDAALESLLDEVMDKNAGMEQTFFEITTALALTAFARTPADIVLLETGLGGRLDSTNVIDKPLATVITTLSYDHTEFLGDTIRSIAGEKAGIMKPGVPCIIAHQIYPEALETLAARAHELNAPLYCENTGWTLSDLHTSSFSVTTPRRSLQALPLPMLQGQHQVRNAVTAITTLLIQDRFILPDEAFAQGLHSASWPARLQRLQSSLLPVGWELWLDGGHNDSAAAALADQARLWAEQDQKPLHIVTGMMGHKDIASFASLLAALSATVTCISMENGHAPDVAAQIWRDAGAASVRTDINPWPEFLEGIIRTQQEGRILVTGSLYLAQILLSEGMGSSVRQ